MVEEVIIDPAVSSKPKLRGLTARSQPRRMSEIEGDADQAGIGPDQAAPAIEAV